MSGTQVFGLALGDSFVSPKSGVTLKVSGFGYEGGLRSTVRATQDGVDFARGVWHADDDGDAVESEWVEVWGLGGCLFHGCVDSASRKVVQVG